GPDGIIATFAGTGIDGYSGDGGPATQARVGHISSLAVGPDGSVYLAEYPSRGRVRKVGPDGVITTVAGTGGPCNPPTAPRGDGGPATLAQLYEPVGIAVGRDGSRYIADGAGGRVRRVGTDGTITTIAGTGVDGSDGDGGPATQATFRRPSAVAVGPDDAVYV